MKHIVNLVVSQPGHEFVSMRSKTYQKSCLQEARSPEEAILCATRKFKNLGFKVHTATIEEQKVPEIQKIETPKQPLTEGYFSEKDIDIQDTQAKIDAAKERRKSGMEKATREIDKSGVENKAGKSQAGSALATYLKKKASKMEESVEYIEEGLKVSDGVKAWIDDFVKSDNPKFEGKSKKERINQALGAYYDAKRALEEEVQVAEGAKMIQDGRKHTKWWVKPKSRKEFGKEFPLSKKDEAEAHAKAIGGTVHKMDQYGSVIKEEVEQIDEVNARHSFVAAQQALTPKSSDIKNISGTTNRDKAKASKYIRRMSKLSGWTKDEVGRHFADLQKEEVELDEAKDNSNIEYIEHNGKRIGEVGIDPNEAGHTGGVHYAMHYKSGMHSVGFDNPEEAKEEVLAADTLHRLRNLRKPLKVSPIKEAAKKDPVQKAKELLDKSDKGIHVPARTLQKAIEAAKAHNFDRGKGYKLEEGSEKGTEKTKSKTTVIGGKQDKVNMEPKAVGGTEMMGIGGGGSKQC